MFLSLFCSIFHEDITPSSMSISYFYLPKCTVLHADQFRMFSRAAAPSGIFELPLAPLLRTCAATCRSEQLALTLHHVPAAQGNSAHLSAVFEEKWLVFESFAHGTEQVFPQGWAFALMERTVSKWRQQPGYTVAWCNRFEWTQEFVAFRPSPKNFNFTQTIGKKGGKQDPERKNRLMGLNAT